MSSTILIVNYLFNLVLGNGRKCDITYLYNQERIVVFDYTRDSQEHINYENIELIKNNLFVKTKYECGYIIMGKEISETGTEHIQSDLLMFSFISPNDLGSYVFIKSVN